MQRVKDPERFQAELDLPFGADARKVVSQRELDADAESFMAFAAVMGVKPQGNGAGAVASSPST